MRKLLLSVLLCVSVCQLSAQSSGTVYQSHVSVNGIAQKEVEPDEIWLSVMIKEADSKDRESVKEQEVKMLKVLRGIGVNPEKSLFVEDMASALFRRDKGTVSKAYQLKLSSYGVMCKVFEVLDKIGINRVSVSKVTRSDMEQLISQLRIDAMKNAAKKAEELAGAVGQTIGKAFYIQDINYEDPGNRQLKYSRVTMDAAGAYRNETADEGPGLELKKIRLRYSVSAKFILE